MTEQGTARPSSLPCACRTHARILLGKTCTLIHLGPPVCVYNVYHLTSKELAVHVCVCASRYSTGLQDILSVLINAMFVLDFELLLARLVYNQVYKECPPRKIDIYKHNYGIVQFITHAHNIHIISKQYNCVTLQYVSFAILHVNINSVYYKIPTTNYRWEICFKYTVKFILKYAYILYFGEISMRYLF